MKTKGIDVEKKVFAPDEAREIVQALSRAAEAGLIAPREENNIYLLASYKGVEAQGISPKWNVKLYSYSLKKRGHSLTCVDRFILRKLLEGDYDSLVPPDLPLLRIDDAGWGFPLCGVMVGVTDEKEVKSALVPVEYFRHDTPVHFESKLYLHKYTDLALELLRKFGATPDTHRIEICSGFVNQPVRERLRKLGYNVKVVEIKGLLQDELELIFRRYVEDDVGADIYYDPKELKKSEIPRRYHQCLEYGRKNCPEKLKTGWKSMRGG